MDASFLDFSQTFDRVLHSKRLLKPNSILGYEQILTWFANYLHDRFQFVHVKENRFDATSIHSDVPRGSRQFFYSQARALSLIDDSSLMTLLSLQR